MKGTIRILYFLGDKVVASWEDYVDVQEILNELRRIGTRKGFSLREPGQDPVTYTHVECWWANHDMPSHRQWKLIVD